LSQPTWKIGTGAVREEAENARHQHLKHNIEVTNASMSSYEHFFYLDNMYEREKAEVERCKADLDLQLSESTKTLEALRAEYNTLKAIGDVLAGSDEAVRRSRRRRFFVACSK
jgi:predicted adenine nucleotide alpha hydrolase (AANH) superfamily ATPase